MSSLLDAHSALFDQVAALRPRASSGIWPLGSPHELKEAFSGYQAVVDACEWAPSTQLLSEWGAGMRVWYQLPPTGDGLSTVPSQLCTALRNKGGAEDGWIVKRVGPMSSSGGYDWTLLYEADVLGLGPVLARSGSIWVQAVSGVFRDATGALTGYPPYHNHHFQLFRADLGRATGALSVNHQDANCYPDQGGEMCGLMALPEGRGMQISVRSRCRPERLRPSAILRFAPPLRSPLNDPHLRPRTSRHATRPLVQVPLTMNSAFNDVRPANSTARAFFWEVAVRYSTSRTPHLVDNWRTNAFPGPMEMELQTFRLPPHEASMAWSTSNAPYGGRILAMWQHCHSTSGLVETWYVAATPDALGLVHGAMAAVRKMDRYDTNRGRAYHFMVGGAQFGAPAWDAWEHPVLMGDVAQLQLASLGSAVEAKEAVLRRMLAAEIPFSCVGSIQLGLEEIGDRQPAFKCFEGGLDVTAGQPLTGLFWYDPATAIHGAPLFQHIHYQAWIDRGEHVSTDYEAYMETSQFPDERPLGFLNADRAPAGTTLGTALPLLALVVANRARSRALHGARLM